MAASRDEQAQAAAQVAIRRAELEETTEQVVGIGNAYIAQDLNPDKDVPLDRDAPIRAVENMEEAKDNYGKALRRWQRVS